MNEKKKASTSELILRQNCLRCSIELNGPKADKKVILETAEEFVKWIHK